MSLSFCPQCGIARTGRICTGCDYDFIEGAKTPAVTLSRRGASNLSEMKPYRTPPRRYVLLVMASVIVVVMTAYLAAGLIR